MQIEHLLPLSTFHYYALKIVKRSKNRQPARVSPRPVLINHLAIYPPSINEECQQEYSRLARLQYAYVYNAFHYAQSCRAETFRVFTNPTLAMNVSISTDAKDKEEPRANQLTLGQWNFSLIYVLSYSLSFTFFFLFPFLFIPSRDNCNEYN